MKIKLNHLCFLILILSITTSFAGDIIDKNLNKKLRDSSTNEMFRVLIIMKDQLDIQVYDRELTESKASLNDRHRIIVEELQKIAKNSQREIVTQIEVFRRNGLVESFKSFWIINAISIEGKAELIYILSQREEVERILLDGFLEFDEPISSEDAKESFGTSEPGLEVINAPKLWKLGITGKGTIVMNIDVGVDGSHPTLNSRWRGNQPGVLASAAWFDPNFQTNFPEDFHGHGTHTMGIMCGLHNGNQDTLGVAFDAQWIAARTLYANPHTSASVEAFQWAIDPDGNPATTDDVPVAISCSWHDNNVSNECTTSNPYYSVINAVETAGIAVVFSAGNDGPNQQTITIPKNGIFTPVDIWATGALDGNDPLYPIAEFSSRGPSNCDGITKKPEASAPGVHVRSCIINNRYGYKSGTSMAAPHICGAIALLRSAFPNKTGTELKYALLNTAIDLGDQGEDNDYGMGLIDVYAAYVSLGNPVVVNQTLENGDRVGTFARWNWDSFFPYLTPPKTYSFENGSIETILGDQDIYSNEKYHDWNHNQDVTNHHIFNIDPTTSTLLSHFVPTYSSIIISNEFLSAIGADPEGDLIEFKDPWFIDYPDPNYGDNLRNRGMKDSGSDSLRFWSRSSPFNPDFTTPYENEQEYLGVFLNQDPLFDPDIPNYSVRAPQTQTIPFHGQDIEWYFQKWSGSANEVSYQYPTQTETAVVFKTANATAKAEYKGHLASSSTEATAFNNGRRIVRKADGTWHMVYEDHGQIYYTSYGGEEWSPEVRLSTGSNNSSPSIAIGYPSPRKDLGVVWNREAPYQNFPVFCYRSFGNWSEEILPESEDHIYSTKNCKPVLIHAAPNPDYSFYILCQVDNIYHEGIALLGSILSVDPLDSEYDEIVWLDNVPETSDRSENPTIIANNFLANTIHFSWQQDDRIYYSSYSEGGFGEAGQISPWSSSYTNPSITYDAIDKINVVWQKNAASSTFQHRRGEPGGGNWEAIREVGCGGCHGGSSTIPSVGAYSASATGELLSTLQVGSFVQLLAFDGDEWGVTSYYYPGTYACLNNFGTELQAIWTFNNEGLPFLIKNQVFSPQGEFENRLDFVVKNYRKELFRLSTLPNLNSKGEVELCYGDILIQQTSGFQNWQFVKIKDSLDFKNFLQTIPLTITNDMQSLVIPYQVNVQNCLLPKNPPSLPLFNLRLINNATGNQLDMLKTIDLKTLTGSTFMLEDTLIVDLTQFRTKEVILQMQTLTHLVSNQKPVQIEIKEFHHSMPTENRPLTSVSQTESQTELPDKFTISQNYPNPFNPSTQISFSLPQAQFVTLEIYDISGRKVRNLINGFKEAGFHQIMWDSKNDADEQVSSGVYIYQIKAGSFIANRKMLLLK